MTQFHKYEWTRKKKCKSVGGGELWHKTTVGIKFGVKFGGSFTFLGNLYGHLRREIMDNSTLNKQLSKHWEGQRDSWEVSKDVQLNPRQLETTQCERWAGAGPREEGRQRSRGCGLLFLKWVNLKLWRVIEDETWNWKVSLNRPSVFQKRIMT